MAEFVVLDVFTDVPFGGNPLAVVTDADRLPEESLQSIAREFNFSETTFVYPPDDAAHAARVRIFTPAAEIPFAGHPTIGTAVALANRGGGPDMVLELGVGPIEAHAANGRARFTTRHPLSRHGERDKVLVAACAGLDPADIASPPVVVSVGLPFVLVEVAGDDALGRACVHIGAFRKAIERYSSEDSDFDLYLYVRDEARIRARMFAPLHGISEDPATGSAAAALAAHLANIEGGRGQFAITQGVEMGRPSRIEVDVWDGAVTVSGGAVEVMRGTLTLPQAGPP